jgi:hypothetical protein
VRVRLIRGEVETRKALLHAIDEQDLAVGQHDDAADAPARRHLLHLPGVVKLEVADAVVLDADAHLFFGGGVMWGRVWALLAARHAATTPATTTATATAATATGSEHSTQRNSQLTAMSAHGVVGVGSSAG